MTQKCNKLKNIAIIHVKISAYRIFFLFINKHEAKKLMANSNVIDKKGFLYKILFYFFIIYIKWIIQLNIRETEKNY